MRRLLFNRRALISLAVIGTLLAVALWPRALPVDVGTVTRGPLVVTVDEEGMTRVRDRFVVSSPVGGRVLRIELEPGDAVKRGQVVARVRAEAAPLLDERSRAEAQAAVERSRAALGRARAEEQRARAALAQLQRELTRIRELAKSRVVSSQELETREADARVAEESVNAAAFAVRAAGSELQAAQARLTPTNTNTLGRVVTVTAPVDGVVLKRMRESESVVPPGDPLLEIGDPRQLEIVSDLLSTDAVRVRPGARSIVEQWGGDKSLEARVRRVEPAGFTKISALGVEEQRVNVVLDFVSPSTASALLGDAYRVEIRIVIWEAAKVLKVPTSALFREGDLWAVYWFDAGRARRTVVELGHQTAQEAEVTSGLTEGTRVILHPGDTLADGARVKERAVE
ncbi:MAG: efflux RND transporter periplasmic adaptor subunit [Vicinamibacterales bacterium]